MGGGGERDLLERSPRQMTDMKRGAGRRARPAVYSCSSLALPLELVPSAPAMGCCASAPGSPGGESAVARARREARARRDPALQPLGRHGRVRALRSLRVRRAVVRRARREAGRERVHLRPVPRRADRAVARARQARVARRVAPPRAQAAHREPRRYVRAVVRPATDSRRRLAPPRRRRIRAGARYVSRRRPPGHGPVLGRGARGVRHRLPRLLREGLGPGGGDERRHVAVVGVARLAKRRHAPPPRPRRAARRPNLRGPPRSRLRPPRAPPRGRRGADARERPRRHTQVRRRRRRRSDRPRRRQRIRTRRRVRAPRLRPTRFAPFEPIVVGPGLIRRERHVLGPRDARPRGGGQRCGVRAWGARRAGGGAIAVSASTDRTVRVWDCGGAATRSGPCRCARTGTRKVRATRAR